MRAFNKDDDDDDIC